MDQGSDEEGAEVPTNYLLKTGDSFPSWDAFHEAFERYKTSSNTVYIIKHSKLVSSVNPGLKKKKYNECLKYKSAFITCKNYGAYETKSTGVRPNQQTFKIGCESCLYIKADLKRQCLIIEKCCLDHTHVTEKEITDFYPEVRRLSLQELTNAQKLMKLRVKPSILLQSILGETGKHLIGQDIVNARHALKAKEREGRTEVEDLMNYLESLEELGDFIIVATDDDGAIQFIFIMHKYMLNTFCKFPEVLLADSTYNTNRNKLPLLLINAVNGLGGTECIGYAFILSETTETYMEVFKQLIKAVGEEVIQKMKTIIVDHDMSEISSICNVFPHVSIQLCTFHVLNAFKRKTKDLKNKEEVREILQKMVYARDDAMYNKFYESLCKMAPSKWMKEYFDKYYHHCPSAWSRRDKTKSINLGNDTTNRNESLNQKIKAIVTRSFEVKETIVEIRSYLNNNQNTMAYRRFLMCAKKSYVAHCTDPDVQCILDTCTQFASSHVRDELEHSTKPPTKIIYATTSTSCTCYFFSSFQLPCRHIMRLRASEGLPRFSKDLVPERWLKSYNMPDTVTHQDNMEMEGNLIVQKMPPKLKPKGKAEKFKSGMQLGGELAELLSICGTKEYESRVAFLKDVIKSWKRGLEVVLYRKEIAESDREEGGERTDEIETEKESGKEKESEGEGEKENESEKESEGEGEKEIGSEKESEKRREEGEEGKHEKQSDGSEMTSEPVFPKLNLLTAASKGRPRSTTKLTAIGSKKKNSGVASQEEVDEDDPTDINNVTLKLPPAVKIVGKTKDCDRTVFSSSKRTPMSRLKKINRNQMDSESEDDFPVSHKRMNLSKKGKQCISSGTDEEPEIEPKMKRQLNRLQKSNDSLKSQRSHKVNISPTPEGHVNSDSDEELDIKPLIKEKPVGFLEIDLVSDSESDSGKTAKPASGTTAIENSEADLSHLLDDNLDSAMLIAAQDVELADRPLCRCNPKKPTMRCISGPNARQPGRIYYVCPDRLCDFWRLARTPKKALPEKKSSGKIVQKIVGGKDKTNKIVQKLFGSMNTLKTKDPCTEDDPSKCCICSTGQPSHSCAKCLRKVHAMDSCSFPAPGEEEGYGKKRICNKCKDCVPTKRQPQKRPATIDPTDSVTDQSSQTSRSGRPILKKKRYTPTK